MFRTSLLNPGLGKSVLRPSSGVIRCLSLKPDFSKLKKIPQPPGHVVGTVNDAYKPPLSSHWEGSYHWVYEKIITIGLIPLASVPFIAGVEHPMFDSIFSVALLWHVHAGLKSCIIDYIPERVWGFWHKLAGKLLTLGTFLGMYGIYVLETANNGLYDLISKLWHS